MAAYARTPSALTWFCVNHLINGLHKQISCKTVYTPLIRTLRYIIYIYSPVFQLQKIYPFFLEVLLCI